MKKEYYNRVEYRDEKGLLHREDGPAVEYNNGKKEWWINGKLHREDGHAIEYSNGSKQWYLKGKWYSNEQDWQQEIIKIKLERLKKLC
jgi:hypothetical protein